MVAELEAHVDDINYEVAIAREKLVRHDVMSHVYAYGQQCPKAAGIIHLGATSCYVGDNTDIIVMREGLAAGAQEAASACWHKLAKFADEYKAHALPGLHPLPARPAHHRGQARYPVDQRAADGSARRSSTVWINSAAAAAPRAPPAPRPALWSCSTATRTRSRALEQSHRGGDGLRRRLRPGVRPDLLPKGGRLCPRRPVRHRPELHRSSPTTCACWPTSRRWKSRLRRTRSVPPPCPTSAIPCAASASAPWPRYVMVDALNPGCHRRHPVV